MGRVLGIIGGGQLGMMLTEAAAEMPEISGVVVLDPVPGCPASRAGALQVVGKFDDMAAIRRLAEMSDIITYEIESGDSTALKSLEGIVEINPSPDTLGVIQDKLLQKSFLRKNGLPVPDYMGVDSEEDLARGLERFGCPAVLKARRGGYDGRGNHMVESYEDGIVALDGFGGEPVMLERFVPYVMEVSVIAARNTAGQTAMYPAVENMHEKGILRRTISPARVSPEVSRRAGDLATDTIQVLRGAGVFGVEMFVVGDGDDIMINEIAPRVHNSGHHTLQSSHTSQFRQHLLAILGMELGSTDIRGPAIMYNILGPEGYSGPYHSPDIPQGVAHLKMYGKDTSKPLRKLGHINIQGEAGQDISELLDILESIRKGAAVLPAGN